MKLSGIVEAALYCDDLKAMHDFYQNILGLTCISSKENQHVFFKINRSVLLIFDRAYTVKQTAKVNGALVPQHATEGPGHLAFEAQENDYENRKAELTDKNINIESEVTWPNGKKSFYFRDPSQNSIEIVEHGLWEN